MENIRKIVLLAMILGIIPMAFAEIGIATGNNINKPSVEITTPTDILYIGDATDNTVKRFDANAGNFIDNFVNSGSGGLDGPRGILFDGNGNLLVSNQNVNLNIAGDILQYNGTTGVFQEALVPHTDKNAPFVPRGIILNGFKLYVADLTSAEGKSTGRVRSYDVTNGNFLGDLDSNAFPNIDFHPRGIVFGPDGNLYVSVRDLKKDGLGGHVLRFKSDGSFDKVFIADEGGIGQLNRPEGLVFGPDGNLYVTSFRVNSNDTDSIRIYSAEGKFLKNIDLYNASQPRAFAQAIVFGPNGRLFVPITNTGEVRQYDIDTGSYNSFIAAGGELKEPWYLIFGKSDSKTLEYHD
jgi:DNA-binding beta-propeller fold protein YncE